MFRMIKSNRYGKFEFLLEEKPSDNMIKHFTCLVEALDKKDTKKFVAKIILEKMAYTNCHTFKSARTKVIELLRLKAKCSLSQARDLINGIGSLELHSREDVEIIKDQLSLLDVKHTVMYTKDQI